jgi:hypothetical protein
LQQPWKEDEASSSFYTLGSAGDDSEKHWFTRIEGFNESDYLENDGITPNQGYFNYSSKEWVVVL